MTSVDTALGADVGGLAGTSGAVISTAIASGAVSSKLTITLPLYGITTEDSTVGGLVGYNHGVITNAIALGPVTANFAGSVSGSGSTYNDQVAGLVANSIGSISNSSAGGAVSLTSSVTTSNGGTSSKMAGGLVGGSFACCGGNSTLTDSFSTSGVSASVVSDSLFIGGLMAYNSGSIASCYALGKVSVNGGSTNTIGGLVGRNDTGGSITSSYWDANQTGVNIGVGSGANTGGTSWIVAPTTMPAGFDSAKWGLAPTIDNGYPYLLWQSAFNLLAPALTTVSVYDNLFAPTTSYTSMNSNGPLYNSFSAGSAPVVLNDVQVNIQLLGSPEGSVNVGLYADNQGQPGTQLFKLGSISDAMITNVPSDYSFPVPGGFTLAPNTQYWIGLSATGSNAAWASTASSAGIGVFGGFNCQFTVAAGMVCVSNFTDPFLMAVSGAPAP